MNIRAKDIKLFIATFLDLMIMEIVFRRFSIGFYKDDYFKSELFIITFITLAVTAGTIFIKLILTPRAGKNFFRTIFITITVVFCGQTVYYSIFETFFTIYSMIHSARVVEFQDVILMSIWESIIPIIIFAFLCTSLLILEQYLRKKQEAGHDIKEDKYRKNRRGAIIAAAVIFVASCLAAFCIGSVYDEDPKSPYQNLHEIGEIQGLVKSSGLLGAVNIDLWRLMVDFEPELEESEDFVQVDDAEDYNVIESIDFKKLAEEAQNPTIKAMHKYFGSIEPTEKNDKTGIFEGKNLIFITAESFTSYAVSEEYTPTLYKLQTEGYSFTNYYNPIWGVSTLDGEYVNLQGLVPKPGVWSMRESAENYLPFTLGNQFEKIGYTTKAYHNHSIYYYDRNISHPNLGYDFKGEGRDYDFGDEWPESDLEMINQTTSDYLTADENGEIQSFHVYYLTVSGHMNYNFYTNDMATKNEETVEGMDLSDECKAYMAANIELDKALELLLERLDEAGELENTVIALAGDHYPYGLKESNISEFLGHDVDTTYEMYKSTMILWTPDMEPETVDKVCCNMDILPTLSNMFGLEYDSRLMMGTDIFSNSEGFVVFRDKNWISDRGTREELANSDSDYVKTMDKKATRIFNYSALILDKNYYSYIAKELESG